ncbi:hypothetical protein B0H11DRAFT_1927151 [Mycena galericulata]|nr:hypothetical protein B0H11DRAFT_1927151 [Mycena galericulata]
MSLLFVYPTYPPHPFPHQKLCGSHYARHCASILNLTKAKDRAAVQMFREAPYRMKIALIICVYFRLDSETSENKSPIHHLPYLSSTHDYGQYGSTALGVLPATEVLVRGAGGKDSPSIAGPSPSHECTYIPPIMFWPPAGKHRLGIRWAVGSSVLPYTFFPLRSLRFWPPAGKPRLEVQLAVGSGVLPYTFFPPLISQANPASECKGRRPRRAAIRFPSPSPQRPLKHLDNVLCSRARLAFLRKVLAAGRRVPLRSAMSVGSGGLPPPVYLHF